MRIEPNDIPTELSYLELVTGLRKDILDDKTMPDTVKRKLTEHLDRVQNIIAPYSA